MLSGLCFLIIDHCFNWLPTFPKNKQCIDTSLMKGATVGKE